ncbi:hypothetical protein KAI58_04820 [Candidatus Gracilibacteria bacterium]|nr:hypothetical protein [Candidatus Gracilibacteria bacterium]
MQLILKNIINFSSRFISLCEISIKVRVHKSLNGNWWYTFLKQIYCDFSDEVGLIDGNNLDFSIKLLMKNLKNETCSN